MVEQCVRLFTVVWKQFKIWCSRHVDTNCCMDGWLKIQ